MLAHVLTFARFGIIGVLAALTHYAIVILLFERGHIALAYANLIAFCLAFWVSYFGHRHFTFQAQDLSHRQTLPKFFIVATLGFVFNESLLLISHHYLNISLSILVIIAIFLTAIFTFLLNRFFAFQH
ncbi:GtrA family protein [Acinetobacter sp. ANC 4641]|uniref:GtrA family protein n=1 Tax=Acinetobacter sp. ANC 4641 TaxID=2529847 RepID=UPI00103A90AF|nr:GtrA family protein [Acinetobacter sp. ANC 4641]TCB11394.1 GtrA family protein [Acinetobacter sp. ANC 4641]